MIISFKFGTFGVMRRGGFSKCFRAGKISALISSKTQNPYDEKVCRPLK